MAASRSAKPTLSDGARGSFYSQLGSMLGAGLTLEHALATLSAERGAGGVVAAQMRTTVAAGQSLVAAGARGGLFAPLDREVVRAAEQAGALAPALVRLGEWHEARASRARLLKSRLVLPAGVLVLAAFVGPLPALVGAKITAATYLTGVLWFLARIFLLAWLLWKLPGWVRRRSGKQGNWLDTLRIRMPMFGEMHVRREVLSVLDAFEMLYTAGLDPDRALATAAANTTNGFVRECFDDTRERLRQGQPLGDAFANGEYLTERARHMIRTGDASGSLTDMLRRFSALERDAIALFDTQVGEWMPRFVYGLVAGWMITQIL